MLAMGRGEDAPRRFADFDRALEADPGCIEARRYRAILLARRGDWDAATREINWCLEREPRSPATLYAAACVVARAYGALGSDATAAQALDLLERAVAEGADLSRAAEDPDLAAIRRLPRFRRLVAGRIIARQPARPRSATALRRRSSKRISDPSIMESEHPCFPPSRTPRSRRSPRGPSPRK